MADYIPQRDAELDLWLNNFQTLVAAAPGTYGLTGGVAVALTAAYDAWHTAFVLATDPGTRTTLTVAQKNAEKIIAKAVFRESANFVRGNPAVSDANQLALGIPLADPVPTPIPPPSTHPNLSILFGGPLTHTLVWADETTPLRRAKPAGVIGLLLYRSIGVTAAVDPAQCDFVGLYTRIPQLMEYGAGDQGKIATYFGRWTNGKGDEGPYSASLVLTVM